MYTLSQIRRRVDALKRKYATELTVVRLYPLAEEFSLLWTRCVADGQPTPETQPFILAIARRGLRLNTFTLLHHYLERCRNEEREPDSLTIISILLPQVPYQRLQELLRRIAPVLDERAAQARHPETRDPAGRPPPAPGGSPHYWAAIISMAAQWYARWYAQWCANFFSYGEPRRGRPVRLPCPTRQPQPGSSDPGQPRSVFLNTLI